MNDERDPLETDEGRPLPPRELMSLIGTDPTGSDLSGLAGGGLVDTGADTSAAPEPPAAYGEQAGAAQQTADDATGLADADAGATEGGGTTSEPRSETFTSSETASAG